MNLRPLTSPFVHADSRKPRERCHATQQPVGSEDATQLHDPYELNSGRGALKPCKPIAQRKPPAEKPLCPVGCNPHKYTQTTHVGCMEPFISDTNKSPCLFYHLQSVMLIKNAAENCSRSSFSETGNWRRAFRLETQSKPHIDLRSWQMGAQQEEATGCLPHFSTT